MRNFLYLLSVLVLLVSCNTENKQIQYTVTVSVDTLIDGKAFLQKRENGEWKKIDSVAVLKGKFSINGVLNYPEMHYLYIENLKKYIPVFLDEGDIQVSYYKDDASATSIKGSTAQLLYDKFRTEMNTYDEQLRVIYKEYRSAKNSGLTEIQDSLSGQMDEIYKKQQQYVKNYAFKNNKDVSVPYIAYSNSYSWSVEEMDSIVSHFDPALHASPSYKLLVKRITVLERVAIGQPLVDFSMKDTSGVEVMLSEVSKGKYMLVDFWASWCSPCRAENPNIVACYRDYHHKGFDVLGVSFDKDRDKWMKAIHSDSLHWNHVSDLKYWNNAAGKLYGIRSIPSSILLSPEGIIIEKNLRGEDLRAKLEELVGSKK
ncbi:MAG: TlpA disulfide reductase family protein [Bacteroidota bacterium]